MSRPENSKKEERRLSEGAVVCRVSGGAPDIVEAGKSEYEALSEAADAGILTIKERERLLSVGAELFAVGGYDGYFKWVGPAWERILGWSPNELTSHPWLYYVHPEDHAATLEEARHLFSGRETVSFENRYRHKNGSWHWLSWKARAFPSEQKIYCAAMEITGRKRNELAHAALAAIVEHSDDAIVGKTLDGIITSWNHGAERIFGYCADEMIGKSIQLLQPPDQKNEELFILNRVRHGISLDHYESKRLTKSGRVIDVSITVSPIRNEAGRIIGASKIARDITDRKIADEARRETDKRKDEFLAMLGHELRNPLAAIRNAVAICNEEAPGDPAAWRWSQQVIDRQSAHLAKIVDDLLDVARITRGKISLRKTEIDVVPVIVQAIEAVRSPLELKRHNLKIDIPAEAQFFVMADPTRLDQIFINLLNNAIKYTPDGGRITVSAARQGADMVIQFRDNGIGIPSGMLPHIFEIFSQGERPLDREDSGLGLGLNIVRQLVELHGGSTSAHSDGPGKGAEFTVRLPLVSQPAQAVAAPARETVRGEGCRILLVDDNEDTTNSLARLLNRRGYEVETALDGPEGLRKAQEFHPQICLLDIGLPGMDGYELARRLRAAEPFDGALLIAVSGYGQKEDRMRSQEAGFNHHLVKPVDFNTLLELLGTKPVRQTA
jgi:PAS domain S-box-containing protein